MTGVYGGTLSKFKLFITYSRKDATTFADQIEAALSIYGYEPMLDRHSIQGGEEWRSRLSALLQSADTVVFILSPASVDSEICAWEAQEANRLSKRIIPIIAISLSNARAPDVLSKLNYIHFYEEPSVPGSGFGSGIAKLIAALQADEGWMRDNTRIQSQAIAWAERGKPDFRLLTGSDIEYAKLWLSSKPDGAPEPTSLLLDFIKASERHAAYLVDERRQQLAEREQLLEKAEIAASEREAALKERTAWQQRLDHLRRFVATFGVGSALLMAWLLLITRNAEHEAEDDRSHFLHAKASELLSTGDAGSALALVLESFPQGFVGHGKSEDVVLEANAVGAKALGAITEIHLLPNRDSSMVRSVDFSPTSNLILATYQDGNARLWDYSTGHVRNLEGHNAPITVGRFSPSGELAVTASNDSTAIVWDTGTGGLVHRLEGHGSTVRSIDLAMSSDGGLYLLTASLDATARLWNAKTGEMVTKLGGHTAGLNFAKFNRNATRAVTASRDGTALIWELSELSNVYPVSHHLAGHGDDLNTADFDTTNTYVVTASDDRTVRLWNANSGHEVDLPWQQPVAAVMGAVFVPNSRTILIWTRDGKLTAVQLDTSGHLKLLHTYAGHEAEIRELRLCNDGHRFATASADQTARLWSLDNSNYPPGRAIAPLQIFRGHDAAVTSVAFDQDCSHVVTGSQDGTLRVWQVKQPSVVTVSAAHTETIHSLAFSPDGRFLASGSGLLQPGGSDYSARIIGTDPSNPINIRLIHPAAVNSVAFSPNSMTVVTAAEDDIARIFDVPSGRLLGQLIGHRKSVRQASFDSSGERVVTASRDGTVRIYRVATSELISSLDTGGVEHGWANTAVFSPDGKTIAIGYRDGIVALWDPAKKNQTANCQHMHLGSVTSVTFSPNGKLLVSSAEFGPVLMTTIDSASTHCIAAAEKTEKLMHAHSVWSVAFSPDGRRLVTAAQDGVNRVWSVEGRNEIMEVKLSARSLRAAVFTIDGLRVATSGEEPIIKMFDIWVPKVYFEPETARKSLVRCLTKEQRRAYFLDQIPSWCIDKWPQNARAVAN